MKFVYAIDALDGQSIYLNVYHVSQVYAGMEPETTCVHLIDRDEPVVVKSSLYAFMREMTE